MRTLLTFSFRILLIAGLGYLWLGFLAIPALGLYLGNPLLQTYSKEPAQLQRLEFNPLSLELRLWQLQIGEQPTLALQAAQTRLDWNQLLQGRIHLSEVVLQQPYARIELDAKGQLNLLHLFDLPTSNQPTTQSPPFPLTLQQVRIEQGSVHYRDLGPKQPLDLKFDPIDIHLQNFSLDLPEPASFELQLAATDGSLLKTAGSFDLGNLSLEGNLSVERLALVSWWPYVREHLLLQLNSGTLQLQGKYQLQLGDALQLKVDGLDVKLQQLELADTAKQPLLKAAAIELEQTSLDLAAQQVAAKQLRINTLATPLIIDQQGQLNWASISPSAKTDGAQTVSTAASTPFRLADIPWHLKLANFKLQDGALDLALNNTPEPIRLKLHALNLNVDGFDSRSEQPLTARLDTRLDEQGQIGLHASVAQQSLASTLKLQATNLDLRPARAWIKPYANIELLSVFADANLEARFATLHNPIPELSGSLKAKQLHIRDPLQNRDLLKWQALNLDNIRFTQQQGHSHLDIGQIHAVKPYARLVINEDQSTNISQILPATPAGEPAAANDDSAFSFALGEIRIESGSANFADYSLQPHFATAIQALNGRIGSLATDQNTSTPLDISGAVDNYAPVRIHGSLTPFDPMQQLDITTDFKNIELTALTPYSGKFAGYRIKKGRLNLALHYQVNKGQLEASNTVVLEKLQLGEKVSSSDAVDLPVRLAVAMLKDTKGDISIHLPVKGDLNSPDFSVMPIVWQTLRNLVARAATSPFKMLGSIGKAGNKDLGQIPFGAGTAQLSPEANALLDSLANALKQRPMLQLNIEGTSAQAVDGPTLAGRVLHRRYQELLYRQLQEHGKQLPADIYSLDVPEKLQDRLLPQIYQALQQSGKVADMPSMPRRERHAWQRQQVLTYMASEPLYLRWLAQQRAAAIRSYLVEQGGLDVERLYLLDVDEKATADNNIVITRLHLDVL
ncbi:MAG: DUF748 domain-containing protein [Thiopseudomonas sp.]|nr:DUF748 domain-containing protein [Thiopseudomonas sp.]